MAARTQKPNDLAPPLVTLPPWTKIVAYLLSALGAVLSILGAIIAWEAVRIVNRVDDLSTRVAVIEERIPQPMSKELAPLTEQVQKLALEIAELRGQLGGKPSPAPAKSKASD